MNYFVVKYVREINEERDGRRRPIMVDYVQFSCLYDSLEEAQHFAEMCKWDCKNIEIFSAPLTLVKQMETA
jgi:hypothetical protein